MQRAGETKADMSACTYVSAGNTEADVSAGNTGSDKNGYSDNSILNQSIYPAQ